MTQAGTKKYVSAVTQYIVVLVSAPFQSSRSLTAVQQSPVCFYSLGSKTVALACAERPFCGFPLLWHTDVFCLLNSPVAKDPIAIALPLPIGYIQQRCHLPLATRVCLMPTAPYYCKSFSPSLCYPHQVYVFSLNILSISVARSVSLFTIFPTTDYI